jgi:hypothetical protein
MTGLGQASGNHEIRECMYFAQGASCGESKDRDDLDLSGTQQALLQELAQLNKPLIVVTVNCRPMTFGASRGAKNGASFFECFPYVCPEPVLAK